MSTSCPTAEITGTLDPAMARATISSLKAQRSSMEPPPLPTMITSTSPDELSASTAAATSAAAP